jgi:hypothetical protein
MHPHPTKDCADYLCINHKSDMMKKVKALCEAYGIPDFSSKVTDAVQRGNGKVPRVRLGVVWRAMPKAQIPKFDDAVSIYVSKGKSKIGSQVTPFHLALPLDVDTGTDDGEPGGTPLPRGIPLELFWQAAKLHPGEIINGVPTLAYYKRRALIYKNLKVKRRYITKGLPIAGAVFGNAKEIINYVDSRRFYCSAYTVAVTKTAAFKLLQAVIKLNVNVLLLGPDAHPMRMGESWCHAYADRSKQFGHERVLAVLLTVDAAKWPWALRHEHDAEDDGDDENASGDDDDDDDTRPAKRMKVEQSLP